MTLAPLALVAVADDGGSALTALGDEVLIADSVDIAALVSENIKKAGDTLAELGEAAEPDLAAIRRELDRAGRLADALDAMGD